MCAYTYAKLMYLYLFGASMVNCQLMHEMERYAVIVVIHVNHSDVKTTFFGSRLSTKFGRS